MARRAPAKLGLEAVESSVEMQRVEEGTDTGRQRKSNQRVAHPAIKHDLLLVRIGNARTTPKNTGRIALMAGGLALKFKRLNVSELGGSVALAISSERLAGERPMGILDQFSTKPRLGIVPVCASQRVGTNGRLAPAHSRIVPTKLGTGGIGAPLQVGLPPLLAIFSAETLLGNCFLASKPDAGAFFWGHTGRQNKQGERDQPHFVPLLPVYGLELPFELQLFDLLESGAVRRCEGTYTPVRVVCDRTRTLPPLAKAGNDTANSNKAKRICPNFTTVLGAARPHTRTGVAHLSLRSFAASRNFRRTASPTPRELPPIRSGRQCSSSPRL